MVGGGLVLAGGAVILATAGGDETSGAYLAERPCSPEPRPTSSW